MEERRFIVDGPGEGGKREASSYLHYKKEKGTFLGKKLSLSLERPAGEGTIDIASRSVGAAEWKKNLPHFFFQKKEEKDCRTKRGPRFKSVKKEIKNIVYR